MAPRPTPIFHLTAIDNLAGIARAGELRCKRLLLAEGAEVADIAYQQIQGRRAIKLVPIAPRGNLHEYVPFYFAPRSPMLMTINSGNVDGCDHRQDDLVHIVSDAQRIEAADLPFVFSDLHAALDIASFYDHLDDLDEIDWPLFFEPPRLGGYCKYWHSNHGNPKYVRRKETRQAEFLVHERVPLATIIEIGVSTANSATRVAAALAGTGWAPPVRVVPDWYY